MAQPFRRLVLDQVGSTNREAFALAACGEAGPLWLMAWRQTAGRGRSGRQWASEPGNLHASLLIQLECPPAAAPQLSLLAGVATLNAIRRAAGDGPAGLRLKWPNDILIGRAKCAGILVETSGPPTLPRPRPDSPPPCGEGLGVGGSPTLDVLESPPPCPSPTSWGRASGATGEGTLWRTSALNSKQLHTMTAVIGIGINLVRHPADLGRAATHLAEHGPRVCPDAMLNHLDEAMQQWLAVWNRGENFAPVRQAWLERAGPVGEACAIDTGRERIAGTFVDLDPNGALVIRDDRARYRTVTFGDVALAPASEKAS